MAPSGDAWAPGGDDTLIGGNGADTLDGYEANDLLLGGAGADSIIGGDGDDRVSGGTGADSIIGGDGDDRLSGGAGADSIIGGDGDDRLSGGAGADSIIGGDGDDRLSGGEDDDMLLGGQGADTISAGTGADTVTGGEGMDRIALGADGTADLLIWYDLPDVGDIISGFEPGLDRIYVGNFNFSSFVVGVSPAADSTSDATFYDSATGRLWLDQDGTGAGSPILLAVFIGRPAITDYYDVFA